MDATTEKLEQLEERLEEQLREVREAQEQLREIETFASQASEEVDEVEIPEVGGEADEAEGMDIQGMSIIEAAQAIARERGESEVKAQTVVDWFAEAGYEGRKSGKTPSKNSVYVTLYKAAKEEDKGVEKLQDRRGFFRLS